MSNLLHIAAIFDLASLVHGTRVDDTSQGTDGWFPFERSVSAFEKCACTVSATEELHYCLIDPQHRLFHAIGKQDTTWIPEEFTDVLSIIKLIDPGSDIVLNDLSQLACAITSNEDLHLCIIDQAGDFWHTVRHAQSSQWLPFGNVQAEINSGPEIKPLQHVACATTQGGNLHVCVVNHDGGLFHTIRFSDTHPDSSLRGIWQDSWDQVYLPGDLSSSNLSDGPDIGKIQCVSCAVNQFGELHVCVVTKAGNLFHTFRHSNVDPFSQAVWQPSFGDIRAEATKSVLDSIDITRPITISVQQDSPQGKSVQLGLEKTGETKARITKGDEVIELSEIVVIASHNTAVIRAITNRNLGGIDVRVEIVISLNCDKSIIGINASAAGLVKDDQFFVTADECDRLFAYVMKAFNAFDQNDLPTTIAFGEVACAVALSGTADLHVCGVTAVQGQKTDGQLWHTIRQGSGRWLAFGNVLTILNSAGSVINLNISHSPHTVTRPGPSIPPKSLRLSARDPFFNTGIVLEKGTRFSILATGQWSNGGGNHPTFVGPNGFEGLSFSGSILKSVNFVSLLGKIGDMIFSIGETFDGESQASGELLLSMNDVPGTFDDNLGELDIRVFVNQGS